MSVLAEKLQAVIEARIETEQSKSREVRYGVCPTCDKRQDQYQILVDETTTDWKQVRVRLLPCEHVVEWESIKRELGVESLADESLIRIYEKDKALVALHKHVASAFPCDTLRILARGYDVEVDGGQ